MNLSKKDIEKEIKSLKRQTKFFSEQAFLDFIGNKCIELLKEETELKSVDFKAGQPPLSYINGHVYETEILSRSSLIKLSNIAVNQFGEYISSYIEYGTGVYSEQTTRPDGWIYPTTEQDKNKTKRVGKNGNLIAYTKGQTAKNIYTDVMYKIERRIDDWIDEYSKGVNK